MGHRDTEIRACRCLSTPAPGGGRGSVSRGGGGLGRTDRPGRAPAGKGEPPGPDPGSAAGRGGFSGERRLARRRAEGWFTFSVWRVKLRGVFRWESKRGLHHPRGFLTSQGCVCGGENGSGSDQAAEAGDPERALRGPSGRSSECQWGVGGGHRPGTGRQRGAMGPKPGDSRDWEDRWKCTSQAPARGPGLCRGAGSRPAERGRCPAPEAVALTAEAARITYRSALVGGIARRHCR